MVKALARVKSCDLTVPFQQSGDLSVSRPSPLAALPCCSCTRAVNHTHTTSPPLPSNSRSHKHARRAPLASALALLRQPAALSLSSLYAGSASHDATAAKTYLVRVAPPFRRHGPPSSPRAPGSPPRSPPTVRSLPSARSRRPPTCGARSRSTDLSVSRQGGQQGWDDPEVGGSRRAGGQQGWDEPEVGGI